MVLPLQGIKLATASLQCKHVAGPETHIFLCPGSHLPLLLSTPPVLLQLCCLAHWRISRVSPEAALSMVALYRDSPVPSIE